jgi:hypothetical protein|tara:strand:- start:213 stop:665 length:453 start_codon:yes stop_codon:yes gene_type:complete
MKRIDEGNYHQTSIWEISKDVQVMVRYTIWNGDGEWEVKLLRRKDGVEGFGQRDMIGSWWKRDGIFKTRLRGDGVHDKEFEIKYESKKKEDMIMAIYKRWLDKESYKKSKEGLADVARRKELEDELHKNEDEHKVILGKIYAVDNKMRNI